MPEAINLIITQPFLQRALVAGVLLSLCAALLGVSLVLKRFSMIGDGLSHVGFGALAIACAANVAPLYFSLPVVIVAAFLLLRMSESGRIKGDAAIALISTGALAVGVMVTSLTTGMNIDIYNYMFGSILTMSNADVALSVVLSIAVLALYIVFYNEIFAVTFDESFSKATGTKVSAYNMLIAALTAVTIVIGMRMMGALLISSLIIFPAVTSMRLCKSYRSVILTSAAVSVLCFFSGLLVSVRFEAPTGASVVCVNIFAFGVFSLLRAVHTSSRLGEKLKKALAVLISVLAVATALTVPLTGSVTVYKKEKASVVATTFAPYDFSRQIAGEDAEVSMLLAPGEESHTFEPTAADIMKIEECDVFVYGGGESDEWVKSMLSSIDTGKISVVRMMDVTENLREEMLEGMQEEDEHEHDDEATAEDAEYDEHVWTSPKNAESIVSAISKALCERDPENKNGYEERTRQYLEKLSALDEEFKAFSRKAAGRHFVVGDRFPFKYLADEYSLEFYAAFPGCSAQSDANPTTIAFLSEKVRNEKIPVIYKVDLSTGSVARSIADSTGAKVETLWSCHVISADDFKNGETYLSLMQRNLSALERGCRG